MGAIQDVHISGEVVNRGFQGGDLKLGKEGPDTWPTGSKLGKESSRHFENTAVARWSMVSVVCSEKARMARRDEGRRSGKQVEPES